MKYLNREVEELLLREGASFVRFVDISSLDIRQNRGLPYAVLMGFAVSPQFIRKVADVPDYLHTPEDDYARTELHAGNTVDRLAGFFAGKGYKALSQSDSGLLASNAFDFPTKTSLLPHKTIAVLGGAGWIGKNNLLITQEYGAAQCLGSILTDAPLRTERRAVTTSPCGKCHVCKDVCPQNVLKGTAWSIGVSRDEMVDVYGCTACLKCLAHCPKTQAYVKKNR